MEEKSSNLKWIIAAVALVVILSAGLIFYVLKDSENDSTSSDNDSNQVASDTEDSQTVDSTEDPEVGDGADTLPTIVFTDDGFAESTYTVSKGQDVTVENNSSMSLEFSSDDHPTHLDEPSLNTSRIEPGESTTFTAPSEAGEYGFHDHINDQFTGVLVVE